MSPNMKPGGSQGLLLGALEMRFAALVSSWGCSGLIQFVLGMFSAPQCTKSLAEPSGLTIRK
jgi:hypothetical protein